MLRDRSSSGFRSSGTASAIVRDVEPRLTVDLHTHSRFAIGCSRNLNLRTMAEAARTKGIDVLTTGDFTHPAWFAELEAGLSEVADGVYAGPSGGRFVLGAEVACIWRSGGRGRRVHILLVAPGLEAARRLNMQLEAVGRLESNGRPILGVSAEQVCRLAWDSDDRFVIIPAHVWTPWYGMYGSKSGFDSIDECFGAAAPSINAVETGLSSDPAMNWRITDLDGRSIVSFSDAHSPEKLGRELTVLRAAATFSSIRAALLFGQIAETVEFFPEHGKYHLDGHTKCGVRLSPEASATAGGRCHKCGHPLTLGVLHRNETLADRDEVSLRVMDGLVHGAPERPPYRRLVPLAEIVAWGLDAGAGSVQARKLCSALADEFGNELDVLVNISIHDLERVAGERIAQGIKAMREGRVEIDPGYDGTYGTVTPVLN